MRLVSRNRKPNQGSSLIMVLVAVAFIGILATVVLSMAMSNLQMKRVDKASKKNFYSAETALDELRTGLEGDVTKIVEDTYSNILVEYATLSIGARNDKFKEKLGYELSKQYDSQGIVTDTNWTNLNTKYSVDTLKKYLVETKANTTVTAKNGQNTLECLFVTNDTDKQYICFKNICLGYVQSGTNLYTQITTDIKIAIPNANFEAVGERPAYTDYAIIANHQLLVDNANNGLVQGNVYAGDCGIVARLNSALTLNSELVIVENNIEVNEGGSITIDDTNPGDGQYDSDIWARDIVTTAASSVSGILANITASGNLYIADDVTINAPNSNITLSGSYYGYSYEDTPEKSSAMIVNRRKSLLDLTNLHNVFIAGRAYIQPVESTLAAENVSSDYVLTGEAISSKANQLAYLLPGDCIGVKADGSTLGHNPLSFAECQELQHAIAADPSIQEVDVDYTLSFSGKKLSYYVDEVKPFVCIFDHTNTSTLVYYYPNFKSEIKSNEYFRDYIEEAGNLDILLQRLADNESYVRLPSNIVNNTSAGRKTYAGNVVAYSDGAASQLYMFDNSVDAELPMQFKREADDLSNMYKAYLKKLVPSVSSTEITYDTLFDSLIVESSGDVKCKGMNELIAGKTGGPNHSYTFTDASYSAYGKFMLVTNSKATTSDVFDQTNAFKVDDTVDSDVHILIATGDVEVKRNFNGIIISKGIVKLSNGAKVTANAQDVFNLICNSDVKTVFRDYNSFPIYLEDADKAPINVSSLITEENWTKN